VLGEPIVQQAQHHHQAQRDDALRLLHKVRGGQEERIFEEDEYPFRFMLVLVDLDQFVVGELRRVQNR
jgi:hypothetical protein